MTAKRETIGIVVLAAGGSSRMNAPKQFLEFEGKTLLRRAVETACASIFDPVVVVLGANFERARTEIEELNAKIVWNESWQNGLSSSIKTGVENLLKFAPEINACVISLADQPFVNARHLDLFAEEFTRTENAVVCAQYDGIKGVPALFSRVVFDDLLALSGDKGAKNVIEKHAGSLSVIDLPEAAFDIDTPQDFLNLSKDDEPRMNTNNTKKT